MSIKVKKRHGAWNKIVSPIITKLIKKKFNYTYEEYDIEPPYIVLGNHTTDYDAFFIAKSFKDPLYFVMSDHISSIPVAGKLIRHLVNPIPITKSTYDATTVRGIMSVIKQGAPVALFPEGNKSWAGEMSKMKPTIAKLLKKLNVPVVIYNIEGGYFSSPRWTKVKRLGNVHGRVKTVIKPEEIEKMSAEELFSVIEKELRVNAYEVQEKKKIEYIAEDLAKNIEALLYVCPKCKAISSLHGEGNSFKCDKCDFEATYDTYGYIHGAPSDRLDILDKMQKDYVFSVDWSKYGENDLITADDGFLLKLKLDKYKNKKLGEFRLEMYNNRFELKNKKETIIIPFELVKGYAIEGANGIQLSLSDGRVYRFNNLNPASGLKYVNILCAITGLELKF